MKKLFGYSAILICALFVCMSMSACNRISKEDYDKLNGEYNNLLEETRELKKVSDWLELYRSIELGQTFNEISALCEEYVLVFHGGGKGILEDGSTYSMTMYAWENRDLFDSYHTKENQIVIVFLDDVAIFKEYGYQNCVLDNGTVRFPAPTLPIEKPIN